MPGKAPDPLTIAREPHRPDRSAAFAENQHGAEQRRGCGRVYDDVSGTTKYPLTILLTISEADGMTVQRRIKQLASHLP